VCITWLGTYRGAFVDIRRILFCSLCNISMFDWDAVPHSGMPYVQIGFKMTLYISSLLVRESLDGVLIRNTVLMYLSQFGSVRPTDLTTVSAEIVTHTVTTCVWEHMFLNDICD
jgi:hypothetical protein